MKELVDKLVLLESDIYREKGEFYLFALFLREEATEHKWDLMVSAPWIKADKKGALNYLAGRIQSLLTPMELLSLSRIILVDVDNPALEAINRAIAVEHGAAEIRDSNFFGLQIKHAYIITSKKHTHV
jgi:hypothetical protein